MLEGRVGAGTGATVAKLGGVDAATPGGVGSAARRLPDGSTVGALVVNNALGNIHARDGRAIAQAPAPPQMPGAGNTVLVVIATDARLDRAQCRKLAEAAHDAIAIAIRPAHTPFDGDVAFAMSSGDGARAGQEAFIALEVAASELGG